MESRQKRLFTHVEIVDIQSKDNSKVMMMTTVTEEVAEVVRLLVASVEEEDMAEALEAVSAEEALEVVQEEEEVPVHGSDSNYDYREINLNSTNKKSDFQT